MSNSELEAEVKHLKNLIAASVLWLDGLSQAADIDGETEMVLTMRNRETGAETSVSQTLDEFKEKLEAAANE